MLGFNFYEPSARYVTPGKCSQIISALRQGRTHPITVGVFVNQHLDFIQEIMAACRLDLAQLAGDEPPEDLQALNSIAFKAVRPRSIKEAQEQLASFGRPAAPSLLVDAHVKGSYGGTGETGDWALARQLSEQVPILLAGGLNPQNVAAAVRAVEPWGVDVASGVESSPGLKDPAMISAFIAAARSGSPE
jgi:phosphoribosylanthranilate isomerase